METRWGVATDRGDREVNEDAALAEPPVFLVADGMGGHTHGAMASRAAVDAFRDLAARARAHPDPLTPADVEAAVAAAAEAIWAAMTGADALTDDPHERSAAAGSVPGPDAVAGTTVSGAVLSTADGAPAWLVLNVGDSRVYRCDGGRLTQLTVDHSLVQEMVDAGTLPPEEARHHPRRNVITRAVGTAAPGPVDLWTVPVRPEDRLLLCTDGLLELADAEIAEVLTAVTEPKEAARALVDRAVAAGAEDNVTVVVVDALGAGAAGADYDGGP